MECGIKKKNSYKLFIGDHCLLTSAMSVAVSADICAAPSAATLNAIYNAVFWFGRHYRNSKLMRTVWVLFEGVISSERTDAGRVTKSLPLLRKSPRYSSFCSEGQKQLSKAVRMSIVRQWRPQWTSSLLLQCKSQLLLSFGAKVQNVHCNVEISVVMVI